MSRWGADPDAGRVYFARREWCGFPDLAEGPAEALLKRREPSAAEGDPAQRIRDRRRRPSVPRERGGR